MKDSKTRTAFFQGVRDGIPIALGYFAVAFSLGIAARNAGLTPFQGFFASTLCVASAGEYALFTMIGAGATYLETAILTLITAGIGDDLPPVALVAVALVCVGVIALGWVESREDEELRRRRQDESNYHYAKSALAIAIPVIYCLLDALGTFADSRVLDRLGEELADACNVAYELTFLAMGIVCAVYVLIIKKQRLIPKREIPKVTGAVFETAGQFFYIYALADTEHVAFSAPIISSYCVASVLWSRLFLKEKLSKKHYACIALVVAGIIIMGILDI